VAVNRHILSILDGESAHGLHKAAGTAHAWKETYLQGEVSLERPVVGPPLNTFHIFCSWHNPGGSALLEEVASELSLELKLTSDEENMEVCDCVLVYLTSLTWTQGTASNAFAMFVKRAMDNNVPLLLAHEMPGLGGQEARHAVDFAAFFSCANGTTPQELLHAGIYSQIAIPLKGGPWRSASLVIIAHSLAKLGAVKSKDTVKAVAALAPKPSFGDPKAIPIVARAHWVPTVTPISTSSRETSRIRVWASSFAASRRVLDRAVGRTRRLRPADRAAIAAPCDPRDMCLREAAPVLLTDGEELQAR